MPDLARAHQALAEDYRWALQIAAGKLLALPSWLLDATVVLIHTQVEGIKISPVRSLPASLPRSQATGVGCLRSAAGAGGELRGGLRTDAALRNKAKSSSMRSRSLKTVGRWSPTTTWPSSRPFPRTALPVTPVSCWCWPSGPTMSPGFWCPASLSVDLEATAPQAPGSLFVVSPTSRNQPDLLATELDLELIAWPEIQHGGS